ncbi:hypothetical protein QAD02_017821 [Eretmocerus hayati]|uniref:Uncharacterized protein n=1 Tax=Eretmocerus hayati TaxID=131215 RepID=A0ACC2PEN3_9HYME|nr:hypothetical protein QAD02_017821 [Eretmocerus hayati]
MRLSTIIELLLIFLIIAFGAYGRTTVVNNAAGVKRKTGSVTSFIPATLKQATDSVNKYCTCNDVICNCCRDLELPVFKLPGPGCASLQYLKNDTLVMQLSVKDNILSSNVITGKNPKPVCVAMPGGFSQFCGKIYSVKRESDDKHFKACLGLELRSSTELEASLRVSCFRFGPDGLRLRPAEPLPTSFSALLDIFTGGDETPAKKKTKTSVTTTTQATATYTIPILNLVTTTSPPTKKSVVTKKTATAATIRTSIEPVSSTQPAEINQKDSNETQDDAETDLDEHASENNENEEEDSEATTKANDDDETGEEVEETTAVTETVITEVDDETAPTNRVVPPSKAPDTKNSEKVKVKKVKAPIRKKDDEKEGTSSDKTKKKADKVTHNQSADDHEDDPDYGYGLAELLARKQQPERTVSSARSGRQSKVMRGFETN